MNKFLTGVFIVLLLVFFAEIGYLFYGLGAKESSSKPPATEIKVLPSATPKTLVIADKSQAISQSTINRLADLKIFKKGVLKSSTIIYIFEGKIIDIKKPSELSDKNKEMPYVKIEGKEGYSNTFSFSGEITDIKIFIDKKMKIPTNFESLNKNDSITIEFNINYYSYEDKSVDMENQLITIIKNK